MKVISERSFNKIQHTRSFRDGEFSKLACRGFFDQEKSPSYSLGLYYKNLVLRNVRFGTGNFRTTWKGDLSYFPSEELSIKTESNQFGKIKNQKRLKMLLKLSKIGSNPVKTHFRIKILKSFSLGIDVVLRALNIFILCRTLTMTRNETGKISTSQILERRSK